MKSKRKKTSEDNYIIKMGKEELKEINHFFIFAISIL